MIDWDGVIAKLQRVSPHVNDLIGEMTDAGWSNKKIALSLWAHVTE